MIHKIVAAIHDANGDADNAIYDQDLLLGTRQKITPYGYQTLLIGNQLQVLSYNQTIDNDNDSLDPATSPPTNVMWHAVVSAYGVLREGISQVRLTLSDDIEVTGTVSYHPSDDRFLLFDIDQDTIPENTISPVNAVINPLRSGPGVGLPAAAAGQRYLLTEDIGSSSNTVLTDASAWNSLVPLVARANDIIEFDGGSWHVDFDSSETTSTQYVSNLTTGLQYRWTGSSWVKSYEGLYPGGEWSLVL